MELIQNADDNQYADSVTPTLLITVRPKMVSVECNEKGFSKENVQALCRTGRTSKPLGDGYTGEKGIGFKSVFKIAERAHIRSPPYYFQLDHMRELGMITPKWDKAYFNDFPQDYQTTIILDRIQDNSTNFSRALRKDLESIRPAMILFLRRVRRLHITLYKSSAPGAEARISNRFRREDPNPRSGIASLIDENSGSKLNYCMRVHAISFTGDEPRRPNVRQTEITLAFPVEAESDSWKPRTRQYPTFAYLPIGDFGFKVSVALPSQMRLY
jgi:hypothetical protein